MSECDEQHEHECDEHECAGCNGQDIVGIMNAHIEKQGAVLIPVVGAKPEFCYTVGLTETLRHPEFIMIGDFNIHQMVQLVMNAVNYLKEHPKAFRNCEVRGLIQVRVHGDLEDAVVGCRPVCERYKTTYLGRAHQRYGQRYKAMQLVSPDRHGKLPWHADFDEAWGISSMQLMLYEADENGK